MNHPHQGRRRQQGVVLIIYVAGALTIVGMVGFALDLGMAYLARTRLQNALDAAALSGAMVLNQTASATQGVAEAQAMLLSNLGTAADEIGAIIETSPTLSPWTAGGANPRFLSVVASGQSVEMRLVQALPGVAGTTTVGGAAVAGPIPVGGQICGAVPVVLCGTLNGDSDCSDGSCFGIATGTEILLKGDNASGNPGNGNSGQPLGPGNYGLINLDCPGGDCIREGLAGGSEFCYGAGDPVLTAPGNKVAPTADGLNTRFGLYHGPVSAAEYPPDAVTTTPLLHAAYVSRLRDAAGWDYPNGVPRRREVLVPVVNCSGLINGAGLVTIGGLACMFLTRPSIDNGPDAGTIYAQLIANCQGDGTAPEDPGSGGAEKIILYKHPASEQS